MPWRSCAESWGFDGSMKLRVISNSQAKLGVPVIRSARNAGGCRSAAIQLVSGPWCAVGYARMQLDDDAGAGVSRRCVFDLSLCSTLVDLNASGLRGPSRARAVPSLQEIHSSQSDPTNSRRRC
jgi:hypothetical protein